MKNPPRVAWPGLASILEAFTAGLCWCAILHGKLSLEVRRFLTYFLRDFLLSTRLPALTMLAGCALPGNVLNCLMLSPLFLALKGQGQVLVIVANCYAIFLQKVGSQQLVRVRTCALNVWRPRVYFGALVDKVSVSLIELFKNAMFFCTKKKLAT